MASSRLSSGYGLWNRRRTDPCRVCRGRLVLVAKSFIVVKVMARAPWITRLKLEASKTLVAIFHSRTSCEVDARRAIAMPVAELGTLCLGWVGVRVTITVASTWTMDWCGLVNGDWLTDLVKSASEVVGVNGNSAHA